MSLILISGLKHSGKSTLGKNLAERLGYEFYDLDLELSSEDPLRRNLSARDIWKNLGEGIFRSWETAAARRMASVCNIGVLALGGGTMDNSDAMKSLDSVKSRVWWFLDEDPLILWERVMAGGIPAFLDPERPKDDFIVKSEQRKSKVLSFHPNILTMDGVSIEKAQEILFEKTEALLGG